MYSFAASSKFLRSRLTFFRQTQTSSMELSGFRLHLVLFMSLLLFTSTVDRATCGTQIIYATVKAPFASLKKQDKTLFWMIRCERKTLFRLKKEAEKYGL